MRKITSAFFALCILFLMASCGHDDSIYAGFERMDNGAYMKFYSHGDSETMPRLKDEVTLEMAQYFNDSLIYSTTEEGPMSLVLHESDFVGDVGDGVLMMHVGDSARLVVMADSVFLKLMNMDSVPQEFAGMPIYYDLKLLSVKPFEVLEVERQAMLESRRQAETEFLAAMQEEPKNTLTELGLIVMAKSGKGKVAKKGDYVVFDFLMCSSEGDTIMNSFDVEPVEMQYGEEFICAGIDEAIGMVPEGGMMRFVVPSVLAFDSVGYQHFIQPYTPLVVEMRMNSVMDKAAYDKKMAEEEAAAEAEKAKRQAEESKTIAAYIAANGVTQEPTESGLYIFPVEAGKGALAQWGDVVSVHCVLRNLQGEIIDSTYGEGEPMSFTIGEGNMVPAIEEAVMTMAPGAKVTVLTPSEMAFGEMDLGEMLPPYSPLLIDLELVEVK